MERYFDNAAIGEGGFRGLIRLSAGPLNSLLSVFVLRLPPLRLLLCIPGAVFACIIGRTAYADDVGVWKLPEPITPEPKADSYPPAARRLDIQGRVLVEFTISPTGRVPRAPTVLLAEEPEGRVILQTAASNYVRGMQFKVPTNWNAVGGPHHKFRVSFVFLLRPCPDGALYEEPAPYFGADRWFKITAPPLEPPAVITP